MKTALLVLSAMVMFCGSLHAETVTIRKKALPSRIININTECADSLAMLPGIGVVKSGAIVDYRHENGYFLSIDDIMLVKGIKSGTFAKIEAYITTEVEPKQ